MILHHEFIRTAKKMGNKLAIKDRTREKDVTYEKALIASLILANKFSKFKENHIGVMVPTSAGCFLTILGVLMAGKVPVMINYSTGAENNCKYAQRKCGFKTIATSKALLEKIKCPEVPGMVYLEDIMKQMSVFHKIGAALKSKLSAGMIINTLPKVDEESDAVILFTSGSEKDPKAVELCHRNISANIDDILHILKLSTDDVMMSILPLFHIFGYAINFWLPMIVGMKAITYANPLDYKKIPGIIKEEKVSILVATPVFFSGYLRESQPGDFESLRLAVAGADKTRDNLREGYQKKHGINLFEGYGATETSPVISVNLPNANKPGSIGKPLPGVQVKITDINTGDILPNGREGKILVKGDLVMKGYFDDLEETLLRIEDGWYDTGDMGTIDDDGYMWHCGRLKRFVKIGGEMVSLVRSESVLSDLLSEDVECCVVEIPDPIKGARLVAALSQKVKEKEYISKMRKELPPIAIPKTFVVIPDMPKMGSGKINFRAITEMVNEMLRK